MSKVEIINGDCLVVLKTMDSNSIDSICCDPPYGISFMGKKWDYDVPSVEVWKECLRVLKHGGHALIACGTRTQHRMAVNLEDAGFKIRDIVAWVYGSGFPKSHNIGKAVDKLQGNAREDLGRIKRAGKEAGTYGAMEGNNMDTKGSSKYEGWGTALKPAMELWTLCRKPLEEKTVASNVLKYGTGGINIDECRVGMSEDDNKMLEAKSSKEFKGVKPFGNTDIKGSALKPHTQGRFPANLIHSGEDEVVEGFPYTTTNGVKTHFTGDASDKINIGGGNVTPYETNSGSASRFFYCAKASKSERNKGLEGFDEIKKNTLNSYGDQTEVEQGDGATRVGDKGSSVSANFHPTVKPIKLMQYLCRLITPVGGTILDPYMGSGSTGIGAKLEGFDFIGIELDDEYVKIAKARIQAWEQDKQTKLL